MDVIVIAVILIVAVVCFLLGLLGHWLAEEWVEIINRKDKDD